MTDIAELYDKKKLKRMAIKKGLSESQAEEWLKQFLADEKKRVPDVDKVVNDALGEKLREAIPK